MKQLPGAYQKFVKEYKVIGAAYDRLGTVSAKWGPLTQKTRELIKLGVSVGAGLEGAVHSHTRRSREAGATAAEIRHTVLLSLTTIGFPSMMAALTWVEDVLQQEKGQSRKRKFRNDR